MVDKSETAPRVRYNPRELLKKLNHAAEAAGRTES